MVESLIINAHGVDCFCGSGLKIIACCIQRREVTIPPEPKTNYSNEKCYASQLKDCSEKLSKEHFLSKSVIGLINPEFNKMKLSGPKWLDNDKSKPLFPKSLLGKVLCERHNNALSSLDSLARKFLSTILLQGENRYVFINGYEIERWMLKLLCGQICTNWHSGGDENWKIPKAWLDILFGKSNVPDQYGLYVLSGKNVKSNLTQAGSWIIEGDNLKSYGGCMFIIGGIIFLCLFDKSEKQLARLKSQGWKLIHRPESIIVSLNNKKAELHTGEPPWGGTVSIDIKEPKVN